MPDITIRACQREDIEAITAIYAHHVRHGTASFEIEPPTLVEMADRRDALLARGFPYLVAVVDGRVVGYVYAGPYHGRAGYRFTVEDTVYLDLAHAGQGIGRRLLEALIPECEIRGYRQMIAVIGDSANIASIKLHARCGFAPIGTFRSVGFKHGRWLDSVLMQRALGEGDETLPEGPSARIR